MYWRHNYFTFYFAVTYLTIHLYFLQHSGNLLRYSYPNTLVDFYLRHVHSVIIGPGRLLQVVEFLQPECDEQALRILAEFRRSRQLDKQIRHVTEALQINR